jgi:hypothetical protein
VEGTASRATPKGGVECGRDGEVEALYRGLLSEFGVNGESWPEHFGFGDSVGTSGSTTTDDVLLDLHGGRVMEHDVTHLHELHHKALNENTAWGAALIFAFAHPSWREDVFTALLDSCRFTHECFATFMSISLAQTTHPEAAATLTDRPLYERAYSRMAEAVEGSGGNHKQDLAATALALLCMQTPILAEMVHGIDEGFALASLRSIDLPDTRLAIILDKAPSMMSGVARDADSLVAEAFGIDIQSIDLANIANERLDEIWNAWSAAIFNGFAAIIRERGGTVPPPHTHLQDARDLLAAFDSREIPTGFRVSRTDHVTLTDLQDSVSATSMTRYLLRESLWPADLHTISDDADLGELLDMLATMQGNDAALVLHAREPRRLSNCYEWLPDGFERLASLGTHPCVAARSVLVTSHAENQKQEVLHMVLPGAEAASRLIDAWGDRGPTALCVSSHCFVDRAFSADWLNPLRTKTPIIVHLDTAVTALLGHKAAHPLLPRGVATWVGKFDVEASAFDGVVWHSDGQPFIGMFIADSLGTQLVKNQIVDGVGPEVISEDADWTQWRSTIRAVLNSILATESFLDLRAGEETVTLL